MKQILLSEITDDLSKYLHLAEEEAIVITRHGKPAGLLVGFASEDDWFDYRLEHDPRFLTRFERAGQHLSAEQGIALDNPSICGRKRCLEAVCDREVCLSANGIIIHNWPLHPSNTGYHSPAIFCKAISVRAR
jgi:hypothetical protein